MRKRIVLAVQAGGPRSKFKRALIREMHLIMSVYNKTACA